MPMTPVDHAIIGGISGTIEVCLLQPTVAMKNAFQEGRRLSLAPSHLYRGIGVRFPLNIPYYVVYCTWISVAIVT
jgi:hypothetical protein